MPSRLHWIDVLRGIAALTIVVFHYHHFYLRDAGDRLNLPPAEAMAYGSLFTEAFMAFAPEAVELFWLISGVVFLHVYRAKPTGMWDFVVARFARLYPLHAATLLFVAAVQAVSWHAAGHWQVYGNNDLRHFALQTVMASNSTTLARGLSFNGPIWSVSLEVPVYMVFFVALAALRRAPLIASAAVIGPCVLLGTEWAHGVDLPLVSYGVFRCAAFFFFGCSVYAVFDRIRGRWSLVVLLAAALGSTAVAAHAADLYSVVVACASAVLVVGALCVDFTGSKRARDGNWLGDMSYAIYLVHVPLQMAFLLVLDLWFGGTRAPADSAWLLPAFVAATLGVAHLAHHGLERPAGRAIRATLGQARVIRRSGVAPNRW